MIENKPEVIQYNNFLTEHHPDIKGNDYRYDIDFENNDISVSLGDKVMYFKSINWIVNLRSFRFSSYDEKLEMDMQSAAQRAVKEYYNRIIKPAEEAELADAVRAGEIVPDDTEKMPPIKRKKQNPTEKYKQGVL